MFLKQDSGDICRDRAGSWMTLLGNILIPLWFYKQEGFFRKSSAMFLETSPHFLGSHLPSTHSEQLRSQHTNNKSISCVEFWRRLTFLSSSLVSASRTTLWCANTRNFSLPLSSRSRTYSLHLTMTAQWIKHTLIQLKLISLHFQQTPLRYLLSPQPFPSLSLGADLSAEQKKQN